MVYYTQAMSKVLLIVEDDPLMSRMYQKIFTFEKYDVDTAVDGQEGLEKARSVKPTVILLDVMMPKMNGMEVLDKLKIDPETKNIPVIMLTNLAGEKRTHHVTDQEFYALKYPLRETPRQ